MAKMVVRVPGFAGEYELDEDRAFTTNEWRWIREVSGYMPLTIQDGFAGGDPTLFVALSVVAMHRSGKLREDQVVDTAQRLGNVPFDGEAITMIGDEVAPDEVPLDLTQPPADLLRTGSPSSVG